MKPNHTKFDNTMTIDYDWKLKDHIQKAMDNYPKLAFADSTISISSRKSSLKTKMRLAIIPYDEMSDYGSINIHIDYNGPDSVGHKEMNSIQTFIAGYLLGAGISTKKEN